MQHTREEIKQRASNQALKFIAAIKAVHSHEFLPAVDGENHKVAIRQKIEYADFLDIPDELLADREGVALSKQIEYAARSLSKHILAASVTLPLYGGVDCCFYVEAEGISVRVIRAYDIMIDANTVRIDAAFI